MTFFNSTSVFILIAVQFVLLFFVLDSFNNTQTDYLNEIISNQQTIIDLLNSTNLIRGGEMK